MNEFLTYEFAVKQKIEGKWLVGRIALISFYVLYVLALLLVALLTRIIVPLLALIPITLWIIIFITWRYVAVEYEYSITSGTLTLSKIYNNRSRRKIMELNLRDAVRIAPLEDEAEAQKATEWKPVREYSAISSLTANDIYFILFEDNNKGRKEKCRAIFYFEATARALQICRYYQPSGTVMTKTQR